MFLKLLLATSLAEWHDRAIGCCGRLTTTAEPCHSFFQSQIINFCHNPVLTLCKYTLPTFYEMVNHDWAAFFTETAELISPLKKLLHLSYKK
jgi:hypothetical protein